MDTPPSPQQRHLKELLEEEQEPFQYLTQLKPNIRNLQHTLGTFPSTSRRSKCFFFSSSSQPKSGDHPYRRSPIFNNTFDALHVPPKTSALLLHAALRVHKHSKPRFRNLGFGLLGSLIRRLINWTRPRDDVIITSSFSSSSYTTTTTCCAGNVSEDEVMSPEHVNYESRLNKQEVQEDKEHNSPVSILDPPLKDGANAEEYRGEEDGFDLACSYSFVQRAKRRVLLKPRKFERLAETKGRIEEEDGDTYDDLECKPNNDVDFTRPWMKRLVFDMVSEEERSNCRSSGDHDYDQFVMKRGCKRLEYWPEVEANTIEMMVGMDLQEESNKWKKQVEDDEVVRAATLVEFCLFKVLVEELLDEFVSDLT